VGGGGRGAPDKQDRGKMAENNTDIKDLAQIILKNPKDINAWISLARLIDDPQKKTDCYKRVIQLDPNNFEAKDFLFDDKSEIKPSQNYDPLVQPSSSKHTTPESPRKNVAPKSPNNNKAIGWVVLGATVCCVLVVSAIYLLTYINNSSKQITSPMPNHSPTSVVFPTNLPLLYTQKAEYYLPAVSELPDVFELRENDSAITINDSGVEVGTNSARIFIDSAMPTNAIVTVVYVVSVYNNIDNAEADYQNALQEMSNPQPIPNAGNFDIGVFEIGFYSDIIEGFNYKDFIYIEEHMRKSNVLIFLQCVARIDPNTDPKVIAVWALYYHNLILSKFEQ